MPMDLRQLRYFVEVADAQSFNEAAARLGVAQSSLSRRVQDLEDELGVRLLTRNARGAVLTAAGTVLLGRATTLLRDAEAARAEVAQRANLPSGEVTIGTSPAFSRLLLGRVAERFDPDHPRLRLHFVEGAQYQIFEGLDTGRIDLAVMVSPDPIRSCSLEPMMTEPLHFVTAPSRRRAPRAMLVSELDRVPLILFPRPSGNRNYLDRKAEEAGIRLDVRYELADLTAQKDFIARGFVAGIMPLSSIYEEVRRRTLAATPIRGLMLTRTLVSRTDSARSPAVAAVAECVRSVMRGLVAEKAHGGDMRLIDARKQGEKA